MKKTLLFILSMLLLIGCTNSKEAKKTIDNQTENNSSTLDTISYTSKTNLTQNIVGDIKDDYPVFEYELSQDIKSGIIQVWEKKDKWENKITSYEDNIYSTGQIAIISGNEAYDIYLIHSKTENELINYQLSYHLEESLNGNEIMFANTLDQHKININEEITLFSTLGYNGNNPTDLQKSSDFRKIDCDYGIVITITFYDTEKAPERDNNQ